MTVTNLVSNAQSKHFQSALTALRYLIWLFRLEFKMPSPGKSLFDPEYWSSRVGGASTSHEPISYLACGRANLIRKRVNRRSSRGVWVLWWMPRRRSAWKNLSSGSNLLTTRNPEQNQQVPPTQNLRTDGTRRMFQCKFCSLWMTTMSREKMSNK